MAGPDHVPERMVVDFDVLGELRIGGAQPAALRWRAEIGPVVWTDHNGGYAAIPPDFHAGSDSQLSAVWSMKSVVPEWDPADVTPRAA